MEVIFFIIAIIIASIRSNTTISESEFFNGVDIDYALQETPDYKKKVANVDPLLMVLVFVVVFSFIFSPIIGVILIPISIFGYRIIKDSEKDREVAQRRERALKKAGAFLSPYSDIWRNLTLSNNRCSLKLRLDGTTIMGTEKKSDPYSPYRTFKVTESKVFDRVELWNLFCINFSYNISYEGLLEACSRFKVSIYEDIITPLQPAKKRQALIKLVDVNNSSEAELTALPGISIVISKKIIKKREEIGGFKNIGEFLTFVNLKPNVTEQLRSQICVKKMAGSLNLERNQERTIDL